MKKYERSLFPKRPVLKIFFYPFSFLRNRAEQTSFLHPVPILSHNFYWDSHICTSSMSFIDFMRICYASDFSIEPIWSGKSEPWMSLKTLICIYRCIKFICVFSEKDDNASYLLNFHEIDMKTMAFKFMVSLIWEKI